MRNLLNFLAKYSYWFLFLVLETLSLALLFRFNRYQQGRFFTSSNYVAGKVYDASNEFTSYFNLRSINDGLLDRNMILSKQVINLRRALEDYRLDSVEINSIEKMLPDSTKLIKAHVIRNSLNMVDNYITLDKGKLDGVKKEMGIVNGEGVVGIVYLTSRKYAVAISLLNSKSSVSCKILGTNYFGYLKWEYGNTRYAFLKELPRHASFSLGDSIVTSGYSSVFPEGIMVGTIEDMTNSGDGFSTVLKVKLSTDFGKLGDVRIISRPTLNEKNKLEGSVIGK
ncbi:MAG: rod shape-determining protein MreC [Bacteroidaceae bacterium]|nr:rod shape-determining protein MreC [Bacteroidaceae bacterium]